MISRMDEVERAASAEERYRLRQVARRVAAEHNVANPGDVAAAIVDAVLSQQMAAAEDAAEERERRADEDTSVAVGLLRTILGNEEDVYWQLQPNGTIILDGRVQLSSEQLALVFRLGAS